MVETSSEVGIWKLAVAIAALTRVALGDGWEGEAELGDLSMPRPCRCELTVGGAWFSTVRRAVNGSRKLTGPACWIDGMAAGFGEKQHAGHPGLGRRRGHGVNLTDNLARRGAVQPWGARGACRAASHCDVSVSDVLCLSSVVPSVTTSF